MQKSPEIGQGLQRSPTHLVVASDSTSLIYFFNKYSSFEKIKYTYDMEDFRTNGGSR